MNQDGTWQERDGIPQEAEPPRPWRETRAKANLDESKVAAHKRDLLERVRSERDSAEQRAEQAELIVAALIRKYGECVERDHAWRAALTGAELSSEVERGYLRLMMDPNSGAMLLRYERPL